jgi:uncharacterized protein GlcG (DUF336 family)
VNSQVSRKGSNVICNSISLRHSFSALGLAVSFALSACSGEDATYLEDDEAADESAAGEFALATFRPAPVVTQAKLKAALEGARAQNNGGFNLDMWATVVDREGVVVAVAFTGDFVDSQWPGSRVISAQKANTANAFGLANLSLATANLYSAVQPGGSLFGLQESNPVDPAVAYGGVAANYGSSRDFMVGKKIGGVNVFGGGLALYDNAGKIVGGLGVSGDSACADHNIAWRTRDALKLDFVPAGVAPDATDNIIYDITGGVSAGGFGHPECSPDATAIGEALPTSNPYEG